MVLRVFSCFYDGAFEVTPALIKLRAHLAIGRIQRRIQQLDNAPPEAQTLSVDNVVLTDDSPLTDVTEVTLIRSSLDHYDKGCSHTELPEQLRIFDRSRSCVQKLRETCVGIVAAAVAKLVLDLIRASAERPKGNGKSKGACGQFQQQRYP